MKFKTLLFIVIASLASFAFAADKVGDTCPSQGSISRQVGGEVMLCTNGNWELSGKVGTTPVAIEMKLTKDGKIVQRATLNTLDGQPAPVSKSSEHTYIAKATKDGDIVKLTPGTVQAGFSALMIPRLVQDGKILLTVSASQTELLSIREMKQGDLIVQMPDTSTFSTTSRIVLEDGKETAIPMGENNQYKLVVSATRGKIGS